MERTMRFSVPSALQKKRWEIKEETKSFDCSVHLHYFLLKLRVFDIPVGLHLLRPLTVSYTTTSLYRVAIHYTILLTTLSFCVRMPILSRSKIKWTTLRMQSNSIDPNSSGDLTRETGCWNNIRWNIEKTNFLAFLIIYYIF